MEQRCLELSWGKDRAGIHTSAMGSRFVSSTITDGIEPQSTKNLKMGSISAPRTEEGCTAYWGLVLGTRRDEEICGISAASAQVGDDWVEDIGGVKARGEMEKFDLVKLGFGGKWS